VYFAERTRDIHTFQFSLPDSFREPCGIVVFCYTQLFSSQDTAIMRNVNVGPDIW
jgi:hypothetical protein